MMNFILKSPIGAAFGAKMTGDDRRYRSLYFELRLASSEKYVGATVANDEEFTQQVRATW